MNPDLVLVLSALALIEVKHFLCDFFIRQVGSELKATYFNRAGFVHAGLHALASIPALLLFTNSIALIGAIATAEFLAHHHVDWLKAWINTRKRLDYSDRLYWILFGGDQLAHQLTYVAILAVLVRTASA